MPRPIKYKQVQHHTQCTCGYNEVETQEIKIKNTDLKLIGAKKRRDKKTGQVFYYYLRQLTICECDTTQNI